MEELIDAQYAIPVVGVLVLALLVFAFGFKSTVQPPNFNYLVDQKQTGGKSNRKKNKEKKSVPNGHIAEPKTKESTANQQKFNETSSKQTDKVQAKPAPMKQSNASPQKAKRNPLSSKNVKPSKTVEKHIPEEMKEDKDGGWTEQISKKEKKSRKIREENASEKVIEKQEQKAQVDNPSPKDTKEKPVEKAPEKQGTEKAVTKSNKNVANSSQKSVPKPDAELEKEIVTAKPEQAATEEIIPVGKNKKKKKKEKESTENKENVEVTPAIIKKEVDQKVAVEKKSDENQQKDSKSPVIDTNEEKVSKDDAKSNVAFDELGDYWQEQTQTKKKRKARREL